MSTFRVCGKCKINKEEDEDNFRLCKYKCGGTYFKSTCKDCEKQHSRGYAKEHREERKKYQQVFLQENPNYIKQWKIDNRDRINKRERKRRQTDINFKLKKNISRAIGHAILKDGNSAIKFLPYTISDLKCHLEVQFDKNMTWENYGFYWHIDHIVPHSTFKYNSMEDEEFRKCWSLGNLRPLEANQNRLEGARRTRHKNT
jgi:hypothetical protein